MMLNMQESLNLSPKYVLIGFIFRFGAPKEIRVSNIIVEAGIEQICDVCGIKIRRIKRLKGLEEFKDSYTIDTLILLNIMLMCWDVRILFYTVWITILTILIDLIILKIRQKKSGNKQIKLSEVPIGFFLCVSNMVAIGIQIIISNYILK